MKNLKIAIVHDYLYQFGGGEKVVETWLEMYPNADLYTSFAIPSKFASSNTFTKFFAKNKLFTTWLQAVFTHKFFLTKFKYFFWLYPLAMSQVKLKEYDLVLISSSYCGKNIKILPNKDGKLAKIIHYCHCPTRFLFDPDHHKHLTSVNKLLLKFLPLFKFFLKKIDLSAVNYLSKKGCIWIANSKFSQANLKKYYSVDSQVVYPPVDLSRFKKLLPSPSKPAAEKYYFYFGRLSFHKFCDLILETCISLRRPLVLAGESGFGPEIDYLRSILNKARLDDPEIDSWIKIIPKRLNDQEIANYLSSTRAFLFPIKEDFGIVPIEVLSTGVPVIAYNKGGALEYIHSGMNGQLCQEQTVESFSQAILSFEKQEETYEKDKITDSVKSFSKKQFTNWFNQNIA